MRTAHELVYWLLDVGMDLTADDCAKLTATIEARDAEHAGEVGRLRKALERIAPLGYGCTVECEHPGCIARRALAAPAAEGPSADTRRGTP